MVKELKKCRQIVKSILAADVQARNDDKYLYIEVVRRIKPSLLYDSLVDAFNDDMLPNYESVRRNRAWLQAHFPELSATDDVQVFREPHRQTHHDFFREVP